MAMKNEDMAMQQSEKGISEMGHWRIKIRENVYLPEQRNCMIDSVPFEQISGK